MIVSNQHLEENNNNGNNDDNDNDNNKNKNSKNKRNDKIGEKITIAEKRKASEPKLAYSLLNLYFFLEHQNVTGYVFQQ